MVIEHGNCISQVSQKIMTKSVFIITPKIKSQNEKIFVTG